jgi:hypothetical protein
VPRVVHESIDLINDGCPGGVVHDYRIAVYAVECRRLAVILLCNLLSSYHVVENGTLMNRSSQQDGSNALFPQRLHLHG